MLILYVTTYTLTVITTLIFFMLLIWHTSTTHLVDKFDMPYVWKADFLSQQMGGLKMWVWVIVFIFVRWCFWWLASEECDINGA